MKLGPKLSDCLRKTEQFISQKDWRILSMQLTTTIQIINHLNDTMMHLKSTINIIHWMFAMKHVIFSFLVEYNLNLICITAINCNVALLRRERMVQLLGKGRKCWKLDRFQLFLILLLMQGQLLCSILNGWRTCSMLSWGCWLEGGSISIGLEWGICWKGMISPWKRNRRKCLRILWVKKKWHSLL